jgi:magnesium transporter
LIKSVRRGLPRSEPGLAGVGEQGQFRGLIPPQRLAAILLDEHESAARRFLKSSATARSAS